ncbi:hypothetical protein HYW74_00145 [Candidatus Pacearchaeota archaeon]|nr:hypothetical protein [Candidatus Pacearchaeota archaeon]
MPGYKEVVEQKDLRIKYEEKLDCHYFDINGHLNPFNSDLLWKNLCYHNVIECEERDPGEGLSYMIKYVAHKFFKRPKKNLNKKVVLDFKDAVFDGVCAVAISLQARKRADSQLEIWANESVIKTFDLYRTKGLFHIIDDSSVMVH